MMTRCNHIESMLTEYLSDELGPLERAIVDEHLAECLACRAELAAAREIGGGVAAMPTVNCPDHLSRDILAAVDADSAGRPWPKQRSRAGLWRRSSSPWGWAGLAGTVAAAVLLAMVLPRRAPESPDVAALPAADSTRATTVEVERARRELLWTLAYTASVIDRSEKRSIADVWRRVRTRTPANHSATIIGGQG